MFRQDFPCLAVLFLTRLYLDFDYRTFTFFGPPSQSGSSIKTRHVVNLGSSAFARRYLQNRLLAFFSSSY